MTRTTRRILLAALAVVPVLALVPASPGGALSWAPAATATVHPGVQTVTNGGQCTANFVFTDGTNVYIGQAAHCSSTGAQTDTNGCSTASLPLGTPVDIQGASRPGTLAYNSWLTMQQRGETDPDICQYNDLALVKVDPADVGKVNPSVPVWGGPQGVNTTGTAAGDLVYTYGNSSLRLGLTALSPTYGVSQGDAGNGWSHQIVTPRIPGDSGSPFLDANGRALGVLSTLSVGIPGGFYIGVGDVGRELGYAQTYGGMGGVSLVDGTEPFDSGAIPIG